MAKQKQREKKAGGDGKGMSGKMIGRIVVYSLLAILIVVGLLDYRAKNAAEATGEAWRRAQREVGEDEDLLQSQLKQYIKGNPSIESRDADLMDGKGVDSIATYSWSGVIRNYHIYVGLGLGDDPPVEAFRGPGDTDPLAKEQ